MNHPKDSPTTPGGLFPPRAIILLLAAGLFGPLGAAQCLAQTYDVRAFGATGDGKTKDTIAFQKALDTCAVNGGGYVMVPAGNYLIGSIQLGDRTILNLDKDATLTGSTDLDDYPLISIRWEGRWMPGHRALIYAANVDHIGVIGPGHITASFGFGGAAGGRGRVGGPPPGGAPVGATTASATAPVGATTSSATPPAGGPAAGAAVPSRGGFAGRGPAGPRPPRGPLLLEPISCNDVRFEDFTGDHSGTWANHPTYCTNVVFRNLTLTNTSDGLDIDSCNGVLVDHCTINGGDDAISIKSGRGMDGARLGKPSENIVITNCTLSDRGFACIGLGSEMSGGVRNMRAPAGIPSTSRRGRGGPASPRTSPSTTSMSPMPAGFSGSTR